MLSCYCRRMAALREVLHVRAQIYIFIFIYARGAREFKMRLFWLVLQTGGGHAVLGETWKEARGGEDKFHTTL